MSATCPHPDAEATLHPECAGCRAMTLEPRTYTDDEVQPYESLSYTRGTPARRRFDVQPAEDVQVSGELLAFATRLARREIGRSAEEQRLRLRRIAEQLDAAGISVSRSVVQVSWILRRICSCGGCGNVIFEVSEFTLTDSPSAIRVEAVIAGLERQAFDRCELIRGELLPDRDLTPEERAAHDEAPRPGVWLGDDGADGRELTQDETDTLIRHRLRDSIGRNSGAATVGDLLGPPRHVTFMGLMVDDSPCPWVATRQRGGIDSDPMVRLLAFRAWGDRDRTWFERDVRPRSW